jgi:hypothetical protein
MRGRRSRSSCPGSQDASAPLSRGYSPWGRRAAARFQEIQLEGPVGHKTRLPRLAPGDRSARHPTREARKGPPTHGDSLCGARQEDVSAYPSCGERKLLEDLDCAEAQRQYSNRSVPKPRPRRASPISCWSSDQPARAKHIRPTNRHSFESTNITLTSWAPQGPASRLASARYLINATPKTNPDATSAPQGSRTSVMDRTPKTTTAISTDSHIRNSRRVQCWPLKCMLINLSRPPSGPISGQQILGGTEPYAGKCDGRNRRGCQAVGRYRHS